MYFSHKVKVILHYILQGLVSVLCLACIGGNVNIVDYLLKTNDIDLSVGMSVSSESHCRFLCGNKECTQRELESQYIDCCLVKLLIGFLCMAVWDGKFSRFQNSVWAYFREILCSLCTLRTYGLYSMCTCMCTLHLFAHCEWLLYCLTLSGTYVRVSSTAYMHIAQCSVSLEGTLLV